jgi:hypothetical protein
LAPLNRGGLNSTHIHGTRAPVEEPSTASKADMCGAISDVRFVPIADIGKKLCRYDQVGFLSETAAAHINWRLAVSIVFFRHEPIWHFEVFS